MFYRTNLFRADIWLQRSQPYVYTSHFIRIRALDLSSVENDSAPPSADEDTAGIVDLLSLDLNAESHALPSDSADLPPDSNFR